VFPSLNVLIPEFLSSDFWSSVFSGGPAISVRATHGSLLRDVLSTRIVASIGLHMSYQDRPVTHHHRRSIRLQGYDYTQSGAYFVTICTHQRAPLFGQVVDGEMVINSWGQIVQSCWDEIPRHFPSVELDAFVVMPNHVHGIIVIVGDVGATHGSPLQTPNRSPVHLGDELPLPPVRSSDPPHGAAPGSLGAILGQYKSSVTRYLNRLPNPPDHPLWQRNYHDHIIRHEHDLNRIREYIIHNSARWPQDALFA
jgi:REP element-mobilizing transposase RayT